MTPETFQFIEELAEGIRARGMEALLEIHSHFSLQIEAARVVDRVYDFALPPLVLHGLLTGSAGPLKRWYTISPRNAVTVLDTHDGIGVIDIGPSGDRPGLLDEGQIDDLVEGIHQATKGESRLATGAAASNVDLYQVNSTFFSAVGSDDNRYLLSRLIQLLSPGVPQVYYAGLLAARNDMALLQRTGVGRDINRPYFSLNDINDALRRPVVQRLRGLIVFRNEHPAFQGEFVSMDAPASELRIRWSSARGEIGARIDLRNVSFELRHSSERSTGTIDSFDSFATDPVA